MSETEVIDIVTAAMWAGAKVSGPVLLTAVGVGILMGLFQSVTQIQEQTLSFVPKFVAVGAVVAVTGNWTLHQLIDFTTELISRIPDLL